MKLRTKPAIHRLCLAVLALVLATACAGSTVAPDPGTAPQISCPVAAPVVTSGNASVAVSFSAPVVTGGATPVTTSCVPPSGINFPVGSTPVTCQTMDALQRTATCSFMVQVTNAPIPIIRLTSFIAFGDSLTLGEDGRNAVSDPLSLIARPTIQVDHPYPDVLQSLLQQRYSSQLTTVVPDGVRGATAAGDALPSEGGVPSRFQEDVIGHAYQVLLLMEGANDVHNGTPSAGIDGLRTMIDTAKIAGLQVFLATIPPENTATHPPQGNRASSPAAVLDFNSRIFILAGQENVPLVDVYSNLDLSLVASDGLHLRPEGYAKVAQLFFDKIRATLEVVSSLGPSARPGAPLIRLPPVRKQ